MKMLFILGLGLFSSLALSTVNNNKVNGEKFFSFLVSEIERVDAEAIATRDLVKKVNWVDFKTYNENHFQVDMTWDQLREAFENFTSGFVNAHSSFKFHLGSSQRDQFITKARMGFEFPQLNFFDLESKWDITKIDDVEILKRFYHYENYECFLIGQEACMQSFINDLRQGNVLVNGIRPSTLTLNDGSSEKKIDLNYHARKNETGTKELKNESFCLDTKDNYQGFDLEYSGINSCLFIRGEVGLIRIKSFRYPKAIRYENIYCQEPVVKDSMCEDINGILTKLTELNTTRDLIFDLSSNGGGHENTPFLTAFLNHPFREIMIRHRKIKELDDKKLRSHLLYGMKTAENWFQLMISNGSYQTIPYGNFLPARVDFCRTGEFCENETINPRSDAFIARDIVLITNGMCASSCDDFVWRMVRETNAKVVGLPHLTDATFTRIKIAFFVNPEGKFSRRSYGQAQKPNPLPEEILVAEAVVPLSMTVDANGSMLTGNPAKLDLVIPQTKLNYESWGSDAVERAYSFYFEQL